MLAVAQEVILTGPQGRANAAPQEVLAVPQGAIIAVQQGGSLKILARSNHHSPSHNSIVVLHRRAITVSLVVLAVPQGEVLMVPQGVIITIPQGSAYKILPQGDLTYPKGVAFELLQNGSLRVLLKVFKSLKEMCLQALTEKCSQSFKEKPSQSLREEP